MRLLLALLLLLNVILFVGRDAGDAPVPSAAPVAEPAGPRLVLLAEADPRRLEVAPPRVGPPATDGVTPGDLAPPPAVQEPTQVEPAPQLCGRAGPYADRIAAERLAVELEALAGRYAFAAETVIQDVRYWVHLPPARTPARARKTLAALQARKIDSFLVTSGEHRNAISLGVFRNRELAERLVQTLSAQGFAVQIAERQRQTEQHWLDYELPVGPEAWQEFTARHRGLKWEARPCVAAPAPEIAGEPPKP